MRVVSGGMFSIWDYPTVIAISAPLWLGGMFIVPGAPIVKHFMLLDGDND